MGINPAASALLTTVQLIPNNPPATLLTVTLLPQPVKAVRRFMVPVRQHHVQKVILPLISLLPIAAQREIRAGFFPAEISPTVKFAENVILNRHPIVRAKSRLFLAAEQPELLAGRYVHPRPVVMQVTRLIIIAALNPALSVRLMPTGTAAPIRYGQLTAIIPAMTNAEPASRPAR